MRESIDELANLLRTWSAGQDLPTDLEGDASRFAAILQHLGHDDMDLGLVLRGATFLPAVVVSTLVHADHMAPVGARFTVGVAATALSTFPGHFLALGQKTPLDDAATRAALLAEQRLYFAYLVAALPECGMPLDRIIATLNDDALDDETSDALSDILENGPEKLLQSPVFTEAERELWKGVLAGAPDGWDKLQAHLVATYQVPYVPAPVVAEVPDADVQIH
jgi:hypothetical protein